MTITTTAPSGNVGRHVVQDLVRAGVHPRVLAHRPQSLDEHLRDHVELRVVDLADRAALADSLHGTDVLFVTVPSTSAEDPLAEYERFGTSIAGAVDEAAVARVVLQSSVGAELRHGAGEIDGLARVEELLDGTGASVLHLRCGYFFSNLLTLVDDLRAGEVPVVLPTGRPMAWVAPVDIARVATSWLLRSDWSGRRVQGVHGPEDLSWEQVASIVTESTGHPVRVRQVPDDAYRRALADAGMSAEQVDAVLGMSTGLRDGFVPEQPRDATTTTPTTLGAWAHDALRPRLREEPGRRGRTEPGAGRT
ncbi:NmrA family NAD(P)-binding protein [Kineococcus sp. G2]|uniref:NmrA family NAD(P)-binding protein n=1 Tax=Kineococcus sp. G2 TaxID=3127484 RepID=UPI00301DC9B7